MRAKDFLSEAINKDVIRLQRELKAAGADLGRYGPAKDGIDGRMGPKTRAAMQKFPEIAVKHKQSVANVPHASDAEVAQADATDARPAMPHTPTPADAYKPDAAVDTKVKPKYDGIDPIVRDRMGMPPATTAEIDAYMKAHPAVVSNVVDGSGKPIISGGAKEVERAARQAAKEYETKTGQNPNISQDTRDEADDSIRPVDGRVSSPFGNRIHPVTGKRQSHAGVDIPARNGTPIKAPISGKVTQAVSDSSGACGGTIAISNGKIQHRFCHCSDVDVRVGQKVSQGDIVGMTGGVPGQPGAGTSTGPHLHWEKKNLASGQLMNPVALA